MTSGNDQSVYWALGGGALLFGGLVSAYVMTRKKSVPAQQRVEHTPAPVIEPKPVAATPAEVIFRPVSFSLAAEPVAAVEAPRASVRNLHTEDTQMSDLEAMVASPPSAENPFLTRKNRMRRAKYIMAHGLPEPLHSDAEPMRERAEEKQFKPQPAYDFSKAQYPQRFSWKPATS